MCEVWNVRTKKDTSLKPCPICGGRGKVLVSYDGKYYVQCRVCYFTTGECINEREAAKCWNRRVCDG